MESENTEELKLTNNSLADLIDWTKKGYIVMLSSGGNKSSRYFSRPDQINSLKVAQIVLSHRWRDLMYDGEWPWYIVDSGCVEFSDDEVDSIKLRQCTYQIFYLE